MKIAKQLIQKIDSIDSETLKTDSLLNGRLGLVYYYYNLYKHFNDEKHLDKIQVNLEAVLNNIESQTSDVLLDSTLENGLSGLGYILQLLINANILDTEYKSEIDQINTVVFDEAIKLIEQKNYDFVRGPFGILFYLSFVNDTFHVNAILEILIEKFKEDEDFFFYNEYTYIEGVHIGYAHGICGIIKVLNDNKDEDERVDFMIEKLLMKLVSIIENNDFYIDNQKYYLPRSIHKDDTYKNGLNYRAVLAWSNSDINFSTLIYSIKEKYVTKKLIDIANEIALNSISRKKEKHTRVWDHRFYFGSSGVLKIYNFLYKKTGVKAYQKAAKYWYKQTLIFLEENKIENHPLNFLNNLPATTLSILEFEEEKDMNWTKILLLL